MNPRMVFGLEIGRNNVRAVAGVASHGTVRLSGVGSSPVRGLAPDGSVEQIDRVVESVRAAILEVEEAAGVRAERIQLAIPGSLTRTTEVTTRVALAGKLATPADLERASRSALRDTDPQEHRLHVRLKEVSVSEGPHARHRPELSATFLVISVATRALEVHSHCVALAGIEVDNVVPAPIAAAEATLSAGMMERGVLLAHLEGRLADVVVYRGGALQYVASVPSQALASVVELVGGVDALPAGVVLTGEAALAADIAAEGSLAALPLRRDGAFGTVRADLAAGIGLLQRYLRREEARPVSLVG
jgi:cell division protein FtsA